MKTSPKNHELDVTSMSFTVVHLFGQAISAATSEPPPSRNTRTTGNGLSQAADGFQQNDTDEDFHDTFFSNELEQGIIFVKLYMDHYGSTLLLSSQGTAEQLGLQFKVRGCLQFCSYDLEEVLSLVHASLAKLPCARKPFARPDGAEFVCPLTVESMV